MAKIVYALSGQGRGHTSRVIAISAALRRRGHEILFCCGGTAREILEAQGEAVLPVPPLRQVIEENRVRLLGTMRENWRAVLDLPDTVARLADAFAGYRADLLLTDFEAFSPRAAQRVGLPTISFNHQQVVTETRYDLPARYWFDAFVARSVIRRIAPSAPDHVLLTSFFFPPLRHPGRATLVPPIIRPAVEALTPHRGDHVLVYFNQTRGAEHVLDTLRQVDASFILYNFDPPADPSAYPNLCFKTPSLDGFLEDLATSRAVLSTAGFTLSSEALFLGKPLLVVPNRGIFEQTINALFLKADGLGEAILDRPIAPDDVRRFLDRAEDFAKRLEGYRASGNKEAIACIEGVLSRNRPPSHPVPALPFEEPTGRPLPAPVARSD